MNATLGVMPWTQRALLALLISAWASPVSAQWDFRFSQPLPVSHAAESSALATNTNPASLDLVATYDITLAHARLAGAQLESLALARELPFGLAVAASVDWQRLDGQDAGRLSLAGSYALQHSLSVGLALRYLNIRGNSGVGLDFGVSFRPNSRLAIGISADNLLGPLGLTRDGGHSAASATGSAQLRPFGDDRFFVEAGARINTDGDFGLRGLASLRVPYLGHVAAGVEASRVASNNSDVRVMALLTANWENYALGGGVVVDAFGSEPHLGELVTARYRAHQGIGLAVRGYVDDVELSGGVGPRRLIALLRRLEIDRLRPEVRGVLLRLRGTGLGLSAAQEIREAITALQASGRPVVCHLALAEGSEAYACAGADEVLIDPAGTVRALGPSMTTLMYGEALRRLGVRTDFVRAGEYKSMVEVYGQRSFSEPVRTARHAVLQDAYARLVHGLSEDRGVSSSEVESWFDRGILSAEEAVERNVVDALEDDRRLSERLLALMGTGRREQGVLGRERTSFDPERVAIVVLDGTLVDGDNVDLPFVEIHRTGAETLIDVLEAVGADEQVKAVVLRIDSPGGSALAADRIWRAIRRLRQNKPVIASMGSMATSAGYYVASACDRIIANPTTLTGSIGVLFGKVDFAPVLERLGVGIEVTEVTPHGASESLYHPFTDSERERLQELIEEHYELFLERIAEGRDMSVEEVDLLARGRVWTGDAAEALGLVDDLGGLSYALFEARRLSGIDPDAPVVIAPSRPSSLLDYVLGSATGSASAADVLHTRDAVTTDPLALERFGQEAGAHSNVMQALSALFAISTHEGPLALWVP